MRKYLFLANGSKPSKEEYESLSNIKLNNFSLPCLYVARSLGYNIFVGINRKHAKELKSNFEYANFYNACIYRSLINLKSNYRAFKNLMHLLKKEKIDVIHCNTPIGGFLGRLCGKLNHVPKIIYTAHGFHFYKGNDWYKNIIFKTAEGIMARFTDAIITINKEDYEAAKKFKLKTGGKVFFVHGVGIVTENFDPRINNTNTTKIRNSLKIGLEDVIIISAGDLVYNKNFATVIRAIFEIGNSNLHYIICGKGPLLNKLKKLSTDLGLEKQIHILGYRSDIKELMLAANIFVSASFREGLPRSTMEAMASGLPCITSNVRGNVDLIENGRGGYLVNPKDLQGFKKAISNIILNDNLREVMGNYNIEKIKQFDVENVKKEMNGIYIDILGRS